MPVLHLTVFVHQRLNFRYTVILNYLLTSANFTASIPVAILSLVTLVSKIFTVVTASFAMVTAPVLASVTSPANDLYHCLSI